MKLNLTAVGATFLLVSSLAAAAPVNCPVSSFVGRYRITAMSCISGAASCNALDVFDRFEAHTSPKSVLVELASNPANPIPISITVSNCSKDPDPSTGACLDTSADFPHGYSYGETGVSFSVNAPGLVCTQSVTDGVTQQAFGWKSNQVGVASILIAQNGNAFAATYEVGDGTVVTFQLAKP